MCQHRVEVAHKGRPIGERRLDLNLDDGLIVENKAIEILTRIEQAQALTYLRITGLSLCLLINYNVAALRDGIRRVILSTPSSRPSRSSRLRG